MSKLHWMPLMIIDLRQSHTWRLMSKAERGCYIDLLCVAWEHGSSQANSQAIAELACSIPSGEELYILADCRSEQDRALADSVIARCFRAVPGEPGRLYNAKQVEVWKKQAETYRKLSSAGKRRWERGNQPGSSQANSQALTPAQATASESGSDSVLCTEGTKNDGVGIPPLKGCQYLRLTEEELRVARQRFDDQGYPATFIKYAIADVDCWLAGNTAPALRARNEISHLNRLFTALTIEGAKKRMDAAPAKGRAKTIAEQNYEEHVARYGEP